MIYAVRSNGASDPKQLDRVLAEIEESPGIVLYTLLDDELLQRLEAHCRELSLNQEPPIFQGSVLGHPLLRDHRIAVGGSRHQERCWRAFRVLAAGAGKTVQSRICDLPV